MQFAFGGHALHYGGIMGRQRLFLGWDVGGTKSAAVVGTEGGAILGRAEWPSNAKLGPESMLADFLAQARLLRRAHKAVCMVGVSIGGPLNTISGEILSPPHLPKWNHVPLAKILRRKLGLQTVVEHDAAACLQAECLWGAAVGKTHAAYLTCGTGCGCGVLIGGRILRGPDGQSPEIGHVRLAQDGPEVFGKAGCVESFCGGTGIGLLASWMFPKIFDKNVKTRDLHDLIHGKDDCIGGHVARGARAKAAQDVLEHSARRTGQVCSILADLFAPQVIVLGSLARYFGPWWVRIVRQEFKRESLPINAAHARIVQARLGKRLQDLSAIAPCVFSGKP